MGYVIINTVPRLREHCEDGSYSQTIAEPHIVLIRRQYLFRLHIYPNNVACQQGSENHLDSGRRG